jgi:large subunit ribosomal protein L34e
MVRPALRSHAQKRTQKRIPGGNTTIHYRRRRPKFAHCPITGLKLLGVPRLRPAKMARLSKSQRRPSRPYGGKISHQALADAINAKVLEEMNETTE